MAQDEGKAGGPGNHGDHGQPEVRHVLGGKPAVADTQHVGHRLEQGPGVLLPPVNLLTLVNN